MMAASRTLRGRALGKLASLSISHVSSASSAQNPDLVKLCEACAVPLESQDEGAPNGFAKQPSQSLSHTAMVPMGLRELEVLFALCDAAPSIQSVVAADRLLDQLCPYVSESCYQALEPSPYLRHMRPTPWETLTFKLVNAVTQIGLKHASLQGKVASALSAYIHNAQHVATIADGHVTASDTEFNSIQLKEIVRVVRLTASLTGYLEASFQNARFWDQNQQIELISSLESLLSTKFLLTVEAALSSIRHSRSDHEAIRHWKLHIKHATEDGRPLGALLLQQSLMKVVKACASLLISSQDQRPGENILGIMMMQPAGFRQVSYHSNPALVETIVASAAREVDSVDEGSDYIRLGSAWEQSLARSIKGDAFTSFLCCCLVNEEIADPEVLVTWLENLFNDNGQPDTDMLTSIALKCMAVLSTLSDRIASDMSRSILRFLVRGKFTSETGVVAADSLLFVLKRLSQDTVITTLYSLGNSLSVSNTNEVFGNYPLFSDNLENVVQADKNEDAGILANFNNNRPSTATAQAPNSYDTIVLAITTVAKGFKDEKITALALSMLVQKVGKVNTAVDLKIIREAAVLATEGGPAEFLSLLRLYLRLHNEGSARKDQSVIQAVASARNYLSTTLKGGSKLYEIYLHHLLETIVSMGESPRNGRKKDPTDFEPAAEEMAVMLRPLALLVASNVSTPDIEDTETFPTLQRDAWYNIVVHGISASSSIGKKHSRELGVLSRYCRPLIADELADRLESDIDLNTVLRRGASSENISKQRRELTEILPQCEGEIKSLDYSELMFLKATYLVETLRASNGCCTEIQGYFIDPQLRGTDLGTCIAAVALRGVDLFVSNALHGKQELFSIPKMALQLSYIFEGCCHRVHAVQNVAYSCANRMLQQIPSALCQRTSLFALLDLLTILWSSCLEAEIDEYEWKSLHASSHGSTKLQLSDDYSYRRYTLRTFHKNAKDWVSKAINLAPLDVKGLLQTYLSDYGDDEAFGHMSLGRSFAFEMGAMIPLTDHRLGAIETEDDLEINTASDFMAQYTTRQEYRFTDPMNVGDRRAVKPAVNGDIGLSSSIATTNPVRIVEDLAQLESSLVKRIIVPSSRLRESLRRAAALLCRSTGDQSTLICHFVRIPFLVFSKELMNFGLSLWMGVIKENPRMESRILVEIIEAWITTVRAKLGVFSPKLVHVDPFYLKEEFAPSDKKWIIRQQQKVHDLIAPSFRVLQFLSSHYAATRLSSSATEREYHRFLKITLRGLRDTGSHPLAREVHFHIVLLGLRFLRHNVTLDGVAEWRLKDDILTAALAWFAKPPRWSFGGNRLQLKAETHLLADVALALAQIAHIGVSRSNSSLQGLEKKQDLLQALIGDEQTRLMVWLFPRDHHTKHHFTSGQQRRGDANSVATLVPTAWNEKPGVAIQLVARFQAQPLADDVRWYLMNMPQQAIDEADALQLLLGSSLPTDISFQLKYLMYWAPVNPITATTYFLPAYGNHPCIIQYAVKALESHSVDVTFFYVPQIVQTLRYDVLGYVERYILETAKFSQLFAHQIIWNMKANAFKDEDATDPDPVKPTLDKVMDSLISGFSAEDNEFYEREFAFFNEVTGISGKLRPFIKKSKPEKKQKIEEELRKIQVDVGVYLPSNPDGVVVGIDRKSGKPLQSHAKAPFMATFRIRKEKLEDIESPDLTSSAREPTVGSRPNTYEVWQSAIFKVGDDCRQDILALQMISAFRGIFHFVGLPVYVFPYRVTATAPGCGVIDVLPASISRDMLGREAVNGLYDWFISNFGGEDSPAFQVARANFVKSLAAYSIISYLLQFKDRHNGNIMFDDQGHVLHIDFGFCFDIAPGGVKFERAPFKLTKEMVAVMGGSTETQSFRWFEELCVKAFLAARSFVSTLSHIVVCMLDSGLPCFKPETMANFRDRFVLEKTEAEAAEFVRGLVHRSYNHYSTHVYDQFQLVTNGIPY